MNRLSILVLALALADRASAQCSCNSTDFNCTISPNDTVCITPTYNSGTDKWDISISATVDGGTSGITVLIEANTDETMVDAVTISNTAGASVELQLTMRGTAANPSYLESVDSITETGGSTGIVTIAFLRTEATATVISVDRMVNATIGGNLLGNITLDDGDLSGTLTVNGTFSGDANIRVHDGFIGTISVPNGSMGGSTNPAYIYASEEIGNILVNGGMYATVLVRDTESSGDYGPVGRIETVVGNIAESSPANTWNFLDFSAASVSGSPGLYGAADFDTPLTIHGDQNHPIEITGDVFSNITIKGESTAPIDVDGHFDATLAIEGAASSTISMFDLGNMSPERIGNIHLGLEDESSVTTPDITIENSFRRGDIIVWQPFEGTLTITNDMETPAEALFYGDFRADALLHIGDTLQSNAIVHFYEGWVGQMVINSLAGSGTWSGLVKYGAGATTLSHTSGVYATPSSTWGGGAVGLVPFNLYGSECDPAPTSYIGGTTDSDVKVAFFGPVTWTSGFPFIVEWFNGSTWVDESTDWAVVSGQDTRHVTIEYDGGNPVPSNRDYRVRPVTSGSNKLVCDDVLASTPPATFNFTYLWNTHTSPP